MILKLRSWLWNGEVAALSPLMLLLLLLVLLLLDIKSVPICDAEQGKFVGMFTATDFVNILRHFYIRGSPMNELAEHSIASWRGKVQ